MPERHSQSDLRLKVSNTVVASVSACFCGDKTKNIIIIKIRRRKIRIRMIKLIREGEEAAEKNREVTLKDW